MFFESMGMIKPQTAAEKALADAQWREKLITEKEERLWRSAEAEGVALVVREIDREAEKRAHKALARARAWTAVELAARPRRWRRAGVRSRSKSPDPARRITATPTAVAGGGARLEDSDSDSSSSSEEEWRRGIQPRAVRLMLAAEAAPAVHFRSRRKLGVFDLARRGVPRRARAAAGRRPLLRAHGRHRRHGRGRRRGDRVARVRDRAARRDDGGRRGGRVRGHDARRPDAAGALDAPAAAPSTSTAARCWRSSGARRKEPPPPPVARAAGARHRAPRAAAATAAPPAGRKSKSPGRKSRSPSGGSRGSRPVRRVAVARGPRGRPERRWCDQRRPEREPRSDDDDVVALVKRPNSKAWSPRRDGDGYDSGESVGSEASLLGAVYGWGANGRGQLGLGDSRTESPNDALRGRAVVCVAALGDRSACGCADGSVYAWGATVGEAFRDRPAKLAPLEPEAEAAFDEGPWLDDDADHGEAPSTAAARPPAGPPTRVALSPRRDCVEVCAEYADGCRRLFGFAAKRTPAFDGGAGALGLRAALATVDVVSAAATAAVNCVEINHWSPRASFVVALAVDGSVFAFGDESVGAAGPEATPKKARAAAVASGAPRKVDAGALDELAAIQHPRSGRSLPLACLVDAYDEDGDGVIDQGEMSWPLLRVIQRPHAPFEASLKRIFVIVYSRPVAASPRYTLDALGAGARMLFAHYSLFHVAERGADAKCPLCAKVTRRTKGFESFATHLEEYHTPEGTDQDGDAFISSHELKCMVLSNPKVHRGLAPPAVADFAAAAPEKTFDAYALLVVRRPADGKFLLVLESAHTANCNGKPRYWIPAGKARPGETMVEAAVASCLRDTNVKVSPRGLLRILMEPSEKKTVRALFFAEPDAVQPKPIKTVPSFHSVGAIWVGLEDLLDIHGNEYRSEDPKVFFPQIASGALQPEAFGSTWAALEALCVELGGTHPDELQRKRDATLPEQWVNVERRYPNIAFKEHGVSRAAAGGVPAPCQAQLPIKREWFEAICYGKKRVEFREASQYWRSRLLGKAALNEHERRDAQKFQGMSSLKKALKGKTSPHFPPAAAPRQPPPPPPRDADDLRQKRLARFG
ncbi:ubiquitin-protein transferase [Aureococcus anophagefferens]|nr:ubiquitin-protein transferase [Aureococcus anophagefferens]